MIMMINICNKILCYTHTFSLEQPANVEIKISRACEKWKYYASLRHIEKSERVINSQRFSLNTMTLPYLDANITIIHKHSAMIRQKANNISIQFVRLLNFNLHSMSSITSIYSLLLSCECHVVVSAAFERY